jgi:hypothetical protein
LQLQRAAAFDDMAFGAPAQHPAGEILQNRGSGSQAEGVTLFVVLLIVSIPVAVSLFFVVVILLIVIAPFAAALAALLAAILGRSLDHRSR